MSRRARSGWISPDTRDEVIDCAGNGVDWNSRGSCPFLAIGGRAQDNVVRSAAAAETAISPHHIHVARAIYGSGRQIEIAKITRDLVFGNIGNVRAGVPALPAVRRGEGGNSRVTFEGNNNGSVGLDERLAAKASGIILRSEAGAPGLPAIARCAHQNVAGAICLIPFGVAV